ncbi:Ribonuclease H-like domain containing protein [Quillaja saponaria]|uniref:Ribonuclease H-like domain containing protein n=1 Tax=Quillaja saponaria TaxID=32244 RepID=A0AAD7M2Z8_QUISA|nr:Ribonuclease H-like domain containing protein [Quillaja saponaria]
MSSSVPYFTELSATNVIVIEGDYSKSQPDVRAKDFAVDINPLPQAAQNDKVFNNVLWSDLKVANKAFQDYEEFKNAHLAGRYHSHQVYRNNSKTWQAPSPAFIKINFDAGVNRAAHSGSLGIVARNSQGSVLKALGKKWMSITSPLSLEALAMREVVLVATQESWQYVIYERDAKQVIKAVQSSQNGFAASSIIIEDFCNMINDKHSSFNFVFCYKMARKTLHDTIEGVVSLNLQRWLMGHLQ